MNLPAIFIVLSFCFSIFNFCTNTKAEKLKLRVLYGQSDPNSKVQLHLLSIMYCSDYTNYHSQEKIHRTIENGENFKIDVQQREDQQTEMFTLRFAFSVWAASDGEFDMTKANGDQSPLGNDNDKEREKERCPICLENMNSENRQVIKLHGKGTVYEHKYHADCITRWVEYQENLRCPLCLTDPKLIMVADFAPIFFDSVSSGAQKLYVNPTAQLFQIANSDENGPFGHGQALHALSCFQKRMEQAERRIKKCLAAMKVPLLMDKLFDETFFELGFSGFAERQIFANVRHELETIEFSNFTQKTMKQAKEVLRLIKTTRKGVESEATAALETIQMTSDEADQEEQRQ